ncbi:MAG: F0F1 ATP synthase subunit delta [Azospirillaceae bacterium]
MASDTQGSSGLASRYATALIGLAEEAGTLEPVAEDMRALRGLLAESEDLRRVVRSPVIGWKDQHAALDGVLEKAGAQDLTRRFVGVVAQARRLFALDRMAGAYLDEMARRRGEVTATVATAQALTDEQKRAIAEKLETAVGDQVRIETTVDPSLLGGMVVRVGSRMIDSSLRSKLTRLEVAMKGVG